MATMKNKKGKKKMTTVKKREVKSSNLDAEVTESATIKTERASKILEVAPEETVASKETSPPAIEEKLTEPKSEESKTITIYAVGKFRRKEALGCYGLSIYKEGKRKPVNHSGHFDSTILAETHLKTLCHAVNLIENPFEYSTIEIVTDFGVAEKFSSGQVIEWKNKEWTNTVKKPIVCAELYKEFLKLYQDYAITFTALDSKDKKVAVVQGVLDKELKAMDKAKTTIKEKKSSSKADEVPEEKTMAAVKEVPVVESSLPESPKESVAETEPPTQTVEKSIPKTGTTAIHLDSKLMEECAVLFEQMGLDVDTAVTMLLKQTLRNKGLAVQL